MKIDGVSGLFKENGLSSKKIDKNYGFKRIFDKKINEITAAAIPDSASTKTDVIKRGNKILNLLDDYVIKLTHPSRTLKEIEPLVRCIEREVNVIESEVAGKTSDDNELEKIMNDLVVTARVATFKFHRGDYI